VVLAVAFLLEGTSLLQAVRQLRRGADEFDATVLEFAIQTSDPRCEPCSPKTAAALVGIAIGLPRHPAAPADGAVAMGRGGPILVGVLLGVVAFFLIDRNRQFLTGEPGSARIQQALETELNSFPEVAEVRFLRPEFIGPKRLFVIASVDLVGDAAESKVAHTLRELEHRLEQNPYVAEAVLTVSEPDDRPTTVRTSNQHTALHTRGALRDGAGRTTDSRS